MLLSGYCHCQSVKFTLESDHIYPFNLCYCSICRKTAGGGGYAINLSGKYETLKVEGREHLRVYQAKIVDRETQESKISPAQRHFCGNCGSHLWLWDPRWPELVHPLASAIDTELPIPPERTHLMLDFKPTWVETNIGEKDQKFPRRPIESIAKWHQRLGLVSDAKIL
jgi:hypothetical protein